METSASGNYVIASAGHFRRNASVRVLAPSDLADPINEMDPGTGRTDDALIIPIRRVDVIRQPLLNSQALGWTCKKDSGH